MQLVQPQATGDQRLLTSLLRGCVLVRKQKRDAVARATETLAFPHHWSAGAGGTTCRRALCQTRPEMLATLIGLDSLELLWEPTTFHDQSIAESSGQGSGLF